VVGKRYSSIVYIIASYGRRIASPVPLIVRTFKIDQSQWRVAQHSTPMISIATSVATKKLYNTPPHHLD